jgi:hypothetical protein
VKLNRTQSPLEKENFTFGKPELTKKEAEKVSFYGRESIKEEVSKRKHIR